MRAAITILTLALSFLSLGSPPSVGAGEAPGAEFVFLQTAEAGSLNHIVDWSVAGLGIHAHIYDTLVDMEGPDLKVTPKLATSWEIVNPTTWRFKLRQGVKFHNGQELTAEDVKFTFETANGPKSVKRSLVAQIDKIEVPDKYTVHIVTKQPDAALLARVAYMYIVNKAAYEKDAEEYGRNPVGTGLYRVVRWDKDQQLVLQAFNDYWGPKAKVARLIVKPVKEATGRLSELQTGRAHVIRGVPVEMAKQLSQDPQMQLIVARGVRQIYYPFNTLKPPFNDKRVRQAFNYAIDREAIVANILEGYGEVRTGPFSPKQWGADPKIVGYNYDPQKARQLLRDAGHANGLDVTWDITSGTVVKDVEIGEVVANMLRQVGVRVRLNTLEAARLIQKYYSAEFEISQISWSLQADPDSILSGLRVHSSASTSFKNETIDRLIDQTRNALDQSKRLPIYHQLHRALVEEAPWMMIHAQDEVFAARKGVNWKPYHFAGNAGMVYFVPMQ